MKRSPTYSRRLLYFTFITFFGIVIVLANFSASFAQSPKDPWESPPRPRPKGQIEKPVTKSKVARHFEVFGTLSGNCRHLWLVQRIGEMHWPKEPRLKPKDGKWKGEVYEGGRPPEGIFDLLLVDVSEETSRMFQTWLEEGHRTKSYPGLTVADLGDATILDVKTYQLIEK